MGGLIVGMLWGALVSGIVLAAMSLSTPLPPRPVPATGEEATLAEPDRVVDPEPAAAEVVAETPAVPDAPEQDAAAPVTPETAEAASGPATEVPLPAGAEFNRPPPEEDAVLPTPDTAPNSASPAAPTLADQGPSPLPDTAPLQQPDVAESAPQVVAVAPEATAPEAPGGDAAAPDLSAPTALSPQETDAAAIETGAIAPPAVPEPEPEQVVEAEPELAEVEETAPETEADVAAAERPRLPSISAPDLGDGAESPSFPGTGNGVTGLPQVQVPSMPTPGTTPDVAEDGESEVALDDGRAITAHAVTFDAPAGRPLLAIVLIDDPESRLDLDTLTRFTFPVTFAIDPTHPEAAARAAAYREAGFEVAILATMFPDGATAPDVEVAFGAVQATLPEAVALMDTPEGRIQSDRPILDATVAALAGSGHGLLAFPQGLNAAEQSARRADVPGATLFRLLDDADQRATEITRFLTRAAVSAAQEGVVVVAGRTRPDTVTALFSWALGERSSAVTLAPLSAALLRASGQ